MSEPTLVSSTPKAERRFGCFQVFGLLVIAVVVTALVTAWTIKVYFFPSEFKPVVLSAREQQTLSAKLEDLERLGAHAGRGDMAQGAKNSGGRGSEGDAVLQPEPYSEEGASREIRFTERELNALLAKNTDLARKLAIDLSDDLVSAKLLVPVDEDFPVLGGKTLRVQTGLVFSYQHGRPVVILKGVSIMGVPIPSAWLGGLKNIDLVKEFGTQDGFWKAFSEGIAAVDVEEGRLRVRLKE